MNIANHKATLMLGDCLAILPVIGDLRADMVLCDLPYSVTNRQSEAGRWVCHIPLEPFWEAILRVVKPNGAIVLFSQGLFTAQLIMSQPRLFKYSLVWDKCRSSGFLNAKKMPLRRHEDICVFYRRLPTFHPQLVKAKKGQESHTRGKAQLRDADRTNRCYGKFGGCADGDLTMKYPGSILRFPRPHCTGNHPTEKSVDLCRWLIRSYTNPGEVVLDVTAGSGTTGVAAVLEGRRCVCIEKEPKYYEVMKRRVAKALSKPVQMEFGI